MQVVGEVEQVRQGEVHFVQAVPPLRVKPSSHIPQVEASEQVKQREEHFKHMPELWKNPGPQVAHATCCFLM